MEQQHHHHVRGEHRPMYAQIPGGLWLSSQAQAVGQHGLGQPPVGLNMPSQYFYGTMPQDNVDKLGKEKKFEKKPIEVKRIGYLHLLPHVVLSPFCFAVVAYAWAFVDRLYYWYVPWSVMAFIGLTVVALTMYNATRLKKSGWIAYTCFSLMLATAAGFYFGNNTFMLVNDYVTFKGMATYVNVNPSEDNGEGFADAGSVYFKEGSRIERMNRKYRSDGNGRDYFVCLQNKLGRDFNANGLSHEFQKAKLRREIGTIARSYSPTFHTHHSHSRSLRAKKMTPNALTFQIAYPLHASASAGQLQTSLRLASPRSPPKTTFRPVRTDSFGRPRPMTQSAARTLAPAASSPDLVLGLRTQTR